MGKLALTLIAILFFGCSDKQHPPSKKIAISLNTDKLYIPLYPVNKFEGSYSGEFSKGFITINLNYVQGKVVSGYNIQRGSRRNLNGTLKQNGKNYAFVMQEPGDKKTDGLFQFTIDTSRFILTGIWKPLDTSHIESIPLLLKKQPKKTASFYEMELGAWIPAKGFFRKDTTLDFSPEGICEYKFYEYAGDSTSRIISVKGSYIMNKDSVFIDWQKNTWTPGKKMKLIRTDIKVRDKDYEEQHLIGHGWNLTKLEGD